MIVNSNEVHSIHTSGRNEAIVLQIPMEKQIMRFSGEKREEDQKLFALLEKMYRQQIRKEYGYELLMQSIFYQLKYLLLTVYQMSDERKEHCTENRKMGRLGKITGYLQEETDLTIGEIALKNGFPNSQAFSRLFREKYGILPTEYQRRQ